MRFRTRWASRLGLLPMVALAAVLGVGTVPAAAQPQAGTTLSQTVSAAPHWTMTYGWTLSKSADQTNLDIPAGQSRDVTYTVEAKRDNGTEEAYITGEVCITNGGERSTENLASTVDVTRPPQTAVVASAPLDVSSHPVLLAGQTRCYPYRVNVPMPPAPNRAYKVTAHTTITNHSGHLGTPFGPDTSADFNWPAEVTPVHDSVRVSDSYRGNLGTLSNSGTLGYTRTFTCADEGGNPNTATLTYVDDGTQGPSANAMVTVNCIQPPGGCTRTIGYWATHQAETSALLPVVLGTPGGQGSITVSTWSQARNYLPPNFNGDASNGINRLYAQLLAAKLNIKDGADDSAVRATIEAADAFLATHTAGDWSSLDRAQRNSVNGWQAALDNYNNGIIGPGHC